MRPIALSRHRQAIEELIYEPFADALDRRCPIGANELELTNPPASAETWWENRICLGLRRINRGFGKSHARARAQVLLPAILY